MDVVVGAEDGCRLRTSNVVMLVHTGEATSEGIENSVRDTMTMTSTFFSHLCAFVAFVAFFSTSVVAQGDLVFNIPHTLIVCTPTNLTWSGGIPPYRLNIAPFDSATKETIPSLNQRFTDINTQFFAWTANFTPGTSVNFNLVDATASQPMSLNQTVMTGSNTSCVATSKTTSPIPAAHITGLQTDSDGSAVPTDSAGTPMQPEPDQEVQHGLSAGAIAGIAVGVGIVAIVVGAITVWCFLRRRQQIRVSRRYSGFDVDRSVVVTPALSEDSTAVMHERISGIYSTLYKGGVVGSPVDATFVPYSGPSSPMHEHDDPLRPTPYLVPRSGSPSGSLSDIRRSAGRKSARDVYGGTAGSPNVSTADVRSATPTQTVSDLPGPATVGVVLANPPAQSPMSEPVPLGSPRAAHVRFETDGGVRLEAGEDVAGHGDGSEAGTSLPPPYSER